MTTFFPLNSSFLTFDLTIFPQKLIQKFTKAHSCIHHWTEISHWNFSAYSFFFNMAIYIRIVINNFPLILSLKKIQWKVVWGFSCGKNMAQEVGWKKYGTKWNEKIFFLRLFTSLSVSKKEICCLDESEAHHAVSV